MLGPQPAEGDTELSPSTPTDPPSEVPSDPRPSGGRAIGRPAWPIFVGLAALVIAVDQLTKAWLVVTVEPGGVLPVLGDTVRLIFSRNSGALFGLFGSAAPVMATVSLGVIGLIVWYHARSGRNLLLSVALGLLLGGAIGNLVDRVRLGYVIDWVDMGIGDLRFWTFNVGDSAITGAILLLLFLALRPTRPAHADADAG